jgi:hypothetical protein
MDPRVREDDGFSVCGYGKVLLSTNLKSVILAEAGIHGT